MLMRLVIFRSGRRPLLTHWKFGVEPAEIPRRVDPPLMIQMKFIWADAVVLIRVVVFVGARLSLLGRVCLRESRHGL